MKSLIKTICLLVLSTILIFDLTFFNHGYKKVKAEKRAPEKIVFLGDSLVHRYNTDEFLTKYKIINSGKDGVTTEDLLDEIEDKVLKYKPDKVFVLIGTNDLNNEFTEKEIIDNINRICNLIEEQNKEVKIYIESLYPINEKITIENNIHKNVTNQEIILLNKKIKQLCKKKKLIYIDVFSKLKNKDNNLKNLYTVDGLHITDIGYYHITELLKKYM